MNRASPWWSTLVFLLVVGASACSAAGECPRRETFRETFDEEPFFGPDPPAPPLPPAAPAHCQRSRNERWRKVSWLWPDPARFMNPENVRARGGSLRLCTRPATPCEGAQLESAHAYRFGDYRASIQAPPPSAPGTGVVSAFFCYGAGGDEIDVEILSKDQAPGAWAVRFTVHRRGRTAVERIHRLGFDPSTGFHVYGFDWAPDRVDFFVDPPEEGAQPVTSVLSSEIDIPDSPARIILNHWTGSSFSGSPPAQPTEMRVDWVEIDPAGA